MLILVLGIILFLGTHSIRIVADSWRTKQIEQGGAARWKGIFSIVSIAGFAMIVWGFGLARLSPVSLWLPPNWTRHLTASLMLIAFILLVATYVPGNRIKALVDHPMLLAVALWAAAHLAANGTLADSTLFGAFLIWSVIDFSVCRRRDRNAGVIYPVIGIWRDLLVVGIGLIAFAGFAHYGHLWLIGVNPL